MYCWAADQKLSQSEFSVYMISHVSPYKISVFIDELHFLRRPIYPPTQQRLMFEIYFIEST